jgi:hypothetical protein
VGTASILKALRKGVDQTLVTPRIDSLRHPIGTVESL